MRLGALRLRSTTPRSLRLARLAQQHLCAYSTVSPPPGDASDTASSSTGPTDADLRSRVLEASMLEVPKLGWTTDALSAGAAACGLSPMAHGLLPRGPIELVEFFSASCDSTLSENMEARAVELEALEVHNRLLVAMQSRLQLVGPHRSSWSQALALRALPANLPNTFRDAHSLASLLLEVCGDGAKRPLLPQPVDPHVKLMSIGAIYGAAELHMLTDSSPELNDTWTFLEREVDALKAMASTTSRLPSPSDIVLSILMRK